MSKIALRGATLIDPEARASQTGTLLVEEGRFVDRVEENTSLGGDWRGIEVPGAFLAPGFIDLHFHGELAHASADRFGPALERSAARMLAGGTTSFLATTMAWPHDILEAALPAIGATIASTGAEGARCVGLHLEGPWINTEAPGAMKTRFMRTFDSGRDTELLDRAGDALAMVTLAPELEGSQALLAELGKRGVLSALGHSRATREEIDSAIGEGLRHVTHLFNAMGPLHHREPGVAGTALAEDRLHCDIICDGAHVHPDMVRVAARALGERLVLISDRVDLSTPPDEDRSRDTTEPNRLPDGTILGSRLQLDRAVNNLREWTGAALHEAIAACTVRPARLLGRESEMGTFRRGARADLVVLDEAGAVVETWLAGVPTRHSRA